MAITTMALRDMAERMMRGETFSVLDVRSRNVFQNWMIKGRSLAAIDVPYYDFQADEVNDQLLPTRTCVIFLTLHDATAKKVADRLLEKGYEVTVLLDGYTAWDEFVIESTLLVNAQVKLVQFQRLATGCLSYAFASAHRVTVIDPIRFIEPYLAFAERENSKIEVVLDTHVHTDHISGAKALLEVTRAEYLMVQREVHQTDMRVTRLKRGTLRFGALDARVITLDTEGNAAGHSLVVLDRFGIFTGDALMVGEVGIPDLPGVAQEWAEKTTNTILRELQAYPDEMQIWPGHFADVQEVSKNGMIGTTLGQIRSGARRLGVSNVLSFADHPRDFVSQLHPNSDEIMRINTGQIALEAHDAKALEREIRL